MQIKPDKHEALNNWAGALMKQRYDSDTLEAAPLMVLAKEKLLQVKAITSHSSYNLACVSATEFKPADFVRVMADVPKNEWPYKEHIDSDNDLDGIRATPEFQTWYKENYS